MTKKEALEFLELPESANDVDIKNRLTVKLSYFEQLSEKSPSVFLRRIHEQNVAKVRLIQKESAQWSEQNESGQMAGITELDVVDEQRKPLNEPEKEVQMVAGNGPQGISAELPNSAIEKPIQVESYSKKVPVQEKEIIAEPVLDNKTDSTSEEFKESTAAAMDELLLPAEPPFSDTGDWSSTQTRIKPGPEAVGWLVRHTENKTIKSIPVFAGKNYIGRKVQSGLKPFIQVDEDLFVSRVHAVLYAEGTGPYLFYIGDNSSSNGGKPSKNGTYVNGSEDRINTRIMLHDYDTIQIGETKFVLRFDITDILKMQEEVEDKGYMHTVIIKLRE
jgi:hypothetical protein